MAKDANLIDIVSYLEVMSAADLPMEHRMAGIVLPDVFNIPR